MMYRAEVVSIQKASVLNKYSQAELRETSSSSESMIARTRLEIYSLIHGAASPAYYDPLRPDPPRSSVDEREFCLSLFP
jgi:hypothetical protein